MNEVNDLMKWSVLNKLIISQQYIYEEISYNHTKNGYKMWKKERKESYCHSIIYNWMSIPDVLTEEGICHFNIIFIYLFDEEPYKKILFYCKPDSNFR